MRHEQTEVFRPGKFTHPTNIDNKWTPMKPGTRWVYEGTSVEDDGKVVPHRIVVTVTDLTKSWAGSGTVVSYDLDHSDGELVEAELAFYAQDDDGNVWQFGEYPEEYRGRQVHQGADMDPRLQGCAGRNHDAGATTAGDAELRARLGSRGWLEGSRGNIPGRTKGLGSAPERTKTFS